MPTSAQSLCLPLTYQVDPGSSPTSTVPRPGTTPCSRSLATRSVSSPLIAFAVAVPSRICAVTPASSVLAASRLTGFRHDGHDLVPRSCACSTCPPLNPAPSSPRSVGKVTRAGEVHRHAGLLGGLDRQLVTHGAAGLDDRLHP